MRRHATAIVTLCLLLTTACTAAESSTDEIEALEQQVAKTAAERDALSRQLEEITAERDVLAAQLAAIEARFAKADASEALITEIIDDPDAYGTQGEVLDALAAVALPGAVMDDTAFGAVGIRSAWRNTLYGVDSKIKTWKRWLSDDGSQGASLWTWIGTARNGEPFELIGVNITDYDEDGMVENILVDWPYEHEYVRNALAEGTD